MKKSNGIDEANLICIHEQAVSDMQDIKTLLNAVKNELGVALDYIKKAHPSVYMPVFDDLKRALKLTIAENVSNLDYHLNEVILLKDECKSKQVGEGDSND